MEATVTQARQDASWQSGVYTIDATRIDSAPKYLSFAGGPVGSA